MSVDSEVAASILSPLSARCLLACGLQLAVAYVLAQRLGARCSSTDRWVLVWLCYDAIVHFTLTWRWTRRLLRFLYHAHFTVNIFTKNWKEYGKADKRWLYSDPTIVSIELLTVIFVGLLAVILIYSILKNTFYRHFLQIALCVCELYGGWMTFCPEWLMGSPSLDTSNWLYFWIYLVFFNGLWIIIPVVLLLQSWFWFQDTYYLQKRPGKKFT
ncbi:EBPL protein, partial [Polypterus senegalus]|nr:EBPL protein [Polypterus senegalus]